MDHMSSSTASLQKGKNIRSEARKENHRVKKSTAEDASNKRQIYEQLYHGFKDVSSAMASMQIVAVPRSIILPISTRGIGFTVRHLVSKLSRLSIKNLNSNQLCTSLYRITLAMLDNKLMVAMSNHHANNNGHRICRPIDLSVDVVRIIGEMGSQFAPIANLINAIGVFKEFGCQYIPRQLNEPVCNGSIFYDPTQVFFSNLRSVVVYLSTDISSTAEMREYFYQHSAIPNAIWKLPISKGKRGAQGADLPEGSYLLANPDEIMPADYSVAQLRADIIAVQDAIELVARKYPKYIATGAIDYRANGLATQLTSNTVEDVRCTDLEGTANSNYAMLNPISGSIEQFWSSELLQNTEFYIGSLHLFGETTKTGNTAYAVRDINAAKLTADLDFTASLQNMLG